MRETKGQQREETKFAVGLRAFTPMNKDFADHVSGFIIVEAKWLMRER